MGLFKKKSFDELMEEHSKIYYGDFQKRLEILKKAAKIAKDDREKLIVNAEWLQLKEDYALKR
jgi:hypothetical protein